jgi:hypothetical protein
MTLNEWLERQGRGSAEALARRANCSRNAIHQIKTGHTPTVRIARRISEATSGEVSVAELLGLSIEERAS